MHNWTTQCPIRAFKDCPDKVWPLSMWRRFLWVYVAIEVQRTATTAFRLLPASNTFSRCHHISHKRLSAPALLNLCDLSQEYSYSPASVATTLFMRKPSSTQGRGLGKVVSKENLPSKVCVVCGRPFTWRKKWERNWEEITTCSKSCNAQRRQLKGKESSDEFES